MQIKIKPFLVEVDDYHSFDSFQRNFAATGTKIEFEEIGFSKYYQAVFWVAGDEEAAFQFMMTDKTCLKFIEEENNI